MFYDFFFSSQIAIIREMPEYWIMLAIFTEHMLGMLIGDLYEKKHANHTEKSQRVQLTCNFFVSSAEIDFQR